MVIPTQDTLHSVGNLLYFLYVADLKKYEMNIHRVNPISCHEPDVDFLIPVGQSITVGTLPTATKYDMMG